MGSWTATGAQAGPGLATAVALLLPRGRLYIQIQSFAQRKCELLGGVYIMMVMRVIAHLLDYAPIVFSRAQPMGRDERLPPQPIATDQYLRAKSPRLTFSA
jgi:hypothetical protein